MPEPALDVRVLGSLEIRRHGRLLDLGTPRQRTLLSRLLLDAGRVVSLDRLIDDLWAGEPPNAATTTLQSYVSNLRKALEPDRSPRTPASILVTRPPGYAVELEPGALDVDRFADDVATGRNALAERRLDDAVTAFERALAHWRGTPFADLDPELDHLADPERSRLVEVRASAVEDRLSALVDLGRHRHVIGELERFVAEHPYRESGWELLVLAHYRSGRQVEALRAFQDARRSLVEHVGVEPGPRLVDLERRVVAQDPSLAWQPLVDATTAARTPPTAKEPPPPIRGPVAGSDRTGEPGAPVGGDGAPGEVSERHDRDDADFVGRDRPLAALHRALDDLRAGTGGLVLVHGEAGIGKTRLVEVALRRITGDDGADVVWGRSVEGDFAPGYWPWTQALGELAATADPLALAAAGPMFAAVVPDAFANEGDTTADRSTDDDVIAARFGVQRAVVRFLQRASARRPVVIVLDDLQWADGSSLRLLTAVVDEFRGAPVLVIATCRPAIASQNVALTDVFAQVARDRGAARIDLEGLDRRDVAAHLAALGLDVDARTAVEVQRRTGGNPFFLTELARFARTRPSIDPAALVREVPHGVADIVRQRLTRLPDTTVALLELAAVAGRSCELGVLATAADLDLEVVLDRLDAAMVSSIVELDPDRPGAARFTHDLVRDATYSTVAPARQVRLHRRVGDALVECSGGDGAAAAQIAQHYAAAMPLGTAPAALEWAEVAARRAAGIGADDEAVVAWDVAVRAHDVTRPGDAEGRYRLLVELAHARRRAWDVVGATVVIHEAIDLAAALDDPVRLVEVASIPSEVALWDWNLPGDPPTRLVEALEPAVRRLDAEIAAGESDRRDTLVRGLGALGVGLRYLDVDRAVDVSDRAIALAQESGRPDLTARALCNAFQARWSRDRIDEQLALAAGIRTVAAEHGLGEDVEAVGLLFRMMNLHESGRIEEFAAGVAEARVLRQRVRRPEVAAQLDYACGTWAALSGDVGEARELVERAWRTRYQESTMWGGEWTYALARTGVGDVTVDEYAEFAERFRTVAASEPTDLVRPTAIVMSLRAGDRDAARRLAEGGPRIVESWASSFSMVQWAEIVTELELDGASDLYRALSTHADGFAVAGSNLAGWGSMHLPLARLSLAVGDRARAIEHLRCSLAVHRVHRFDRLEARSRELLVEIGEDPDEQLPGGG